ncbi:glycoside hydrolase family 92 protein [Tilletiaria anomala UBC 951]|uniref:Glycoside hydrolase family 92 protein n=1 Tax=Tilletiaria anomala (strain ATCC 24038 / CBS 436.72 / UBC 951) TaxID=1037660 RepID=A0A066WR48_TILAU|nr:glycoside hydrolase family 92 protein [Tilletiaria anomala UBC 951]KDN53474.1 glycoside hydrolase family 92 protein [Tilletiaria anomala UBC 951]
MQANTQDLAALSFLELQKSGSISSSQAGYAPTGHNDDAALPVRGMSPLHDLGTQLILLQLRETLRGGRSCALRASSTCALRLWTHASACISLSTATASQDYLPRRSTTTSTELGSTRRAGLQRYTFPASLLIQFSSAPFIVQDWTNELPAPGAAARSTLASRTASYCSGARTTCTAASSSLGGSAYTYQAPASSNLLHNNKQKVSQAGLWADNCFGQDTKLLREQSAHLIGC